MYMNEKNQSNQNIADIGATLWGNELQYNGASWVQNQHFWLMGTISFLNSAKVLCLRMNDKSNYAFCLTH